MFLKKALGLTVAVFLTNLSTSVFADAGQITGTWLCQQQLSPDPQIQIEVRYEQQFSANRHFNIDGQLDAQFAGNALAYTFRGHGNWSVEGKFLDINTTDSEFRPANSTAQQMHDLGILSADQFNNLQSKDRFTLTKLNQQEMHLEHTREDFRTQCVRR